ncbi:hypothetical protein GN277_05145 [Lachnospiraceae bacterium WCA-9-b2]|uniref:Uncharacterized protein n=1 Tax=Sporofaciens musculi TaxID=2681861 RepID=A0A7X3SHV9_9FIRM|nr:hypothetical protein [Sporofaciens musculi]
MREKKNCIVVLSEYPSHSGLLNVNYQVTTTVAGLKRAKAEGREFIFKTRCDYRFYKRELIHYLYNLVIQFPLEDSEHCQKYRIVAGSEIMNSMFKPFWLADQFNYGQVDDMIQYWSHPMDSFNLDKRAHREIMKQKEYSWKEQIENNMGAESELVLSFLERTLGKRPEISVEEYWRIVKERFIVVSRQELGAYWHKYLLRYDESVAEGELHDGASPENGLTYNWDFSSWFSLYCGNLIYDNSYERFAKNNGWKDVNTNVRCYNSKCKIDSRGASENR